MMPFAPYYGRKSHKVNCLLALLIILVRDKGKLSVDLETKHQENDMPPPNCDCEKIVIPSWLLKLVEVFIPVLLAAVWMYYQVQDLEKKNQDMGKRIEQMEARINQRDVSLSHYDTQFAVITERHNALEKTMNTALSSIADTVKEIKDEIKTMHADIKRVIPQPYSTSSKEAAAK
jgi:septal ring factor EnvC (AmiA/AmiB activator)